MSGSASVSRNPDSCSPKTDSVISAMTRSSSPRISPSIVPRPNLRRKSERSSDVISRSPLSNPSTTAFAGCVVTAGAHASTPMSACRLDTTESARTTPSMSRQAQFPRTSWHTVPDRSARRTMSSTWASMPPSRPFKSTDRSS